MIDHHDRYIEEQKVTVVFDWLQSYTTFFIVQRRFEYISNSLGESLNRQPSNVRRDVCNCVSGGCIYIIENNIVSIDVVACNLDEHGGPYYLSSNSLFLILSRS
jgi:hypothetical protein